MAESESGNEAQAMEEYWALQRDPVLRGEGVPQGDGRKVLVLPGLFGNDLYLQTLHTWLNRIGYDPVASDIMWNVGCPKRLLQSVTEKLEQLLIEDEKPLAVIGHSRGGLLAKALVSRFAAQCSHLIVIGSPLGGMLRAGPHRMEAYASFMQSEQGLRQFVFSAGKRLTQMLDPDCDSPSCGCAYFDDLFAQLPEHVATTSIFSASDPVVPSAGSVMPYGNNIQVQGTHSGLMFNREVYPHIAAALVNSA